MTEVAVELNARLLMFPEMVETSSANKRIICSAQVPLGYHLDKPLINSVLFI